MILEQITWGQVRKGMRLLLAQEDGPQLVARTGAAYYPFERRVWLDGNGWIDAQPHLPVTVVR